MRYRHSTLARMAAAACLAGLAMTAHGCRASAGSFQDALPSLSRVEGTAVRGKSSADTSAAFELSSAAVVDGELLPEYRGEPKDALGREDSIPLAWSGVPAGTTSLAVIMHHYPKPGDSSEVNSYLLLWGIDPTVAEVAHGAADDGPWFMGANKDGKVVSYTSPNSPSPGKHEYTITLYALAASPPSLPSTSTTAVTYRVLKEAIDSVSVLDTATLTFTSEGRLVPTP
jgi:phosphatidylethanolamine-binding protein (PEBP) family uncharacterized protein